MPVVPDNGPYPWQKHKRDPELEKLAQQVADQFDLAHQDDGRTTYVDAFYSLLEHQIIEVGPGLFRP